MSESEGNPELWAAIKLLVQRTEQAERRLTRLEALTLPCASEPATGSTQQDMSGNLVFVASTDDDDEVTASSACPKCHAPMGEHFVRPQWVECPVADKAREAEVVPARMILTCPSCGQQHVDEGEWATRVHRTHQCVAGPFGKGCGREWRPDPIATVGVRHADLKQPADKASEPEGVTEQRRPDAEPEGSCIEGALEGFEHIQADRVLRAAAESVGYYDSHGRFTSLAWPLKRLIASHDTLMRQRRERAKP